MSTDRWRKRLGWVESRTESITVSVTPGGGPAKPKVGLLAAAGVIASGPFRARAPSSAKADEASGVAN
jgi:hypothetical protein